MDFGTIPPEIYCKRLFASSDSSNESEKEMELVATSFSCKTAASEDTGIIVFQ